MCQPVNLNLNGDRSQLCISKEVIFLSFFTTVNLTLRASVDRCESFRVMYVEKVPKRYSSGQSNN